MTHTHTITVCVMSDRTEIARQCAAPCACTPKVWAQYPTVQRQAHACAGHKWTMNAHADTAPKRTRGAQSCVVTKCSMMAPHNVHIHQYGVRNAQSYKGLAGVQRHALTHQRSVSVPDVQKEIHAQPVPRHSAHATRVKHVKPRPKPYVQARTAPYGHYG